MTQPELDATRYLQHAGRQCPVCHLEGVWHEVIDARGEIVHDVRLLLVSCWCTRCSADWVETYRLVGVHVHISDAEETARKTYAKPGDKHTS
jgi:uncharacterized Zn finger protein